MSSLPRTFAGDVVIDHVDHEIHIDGVRIPWWISAAEGPRIEKVQDLPIHVLHLPIFVEGVVTIVGDDGMKHTHDPVLGNVRQWARRSVREAFREAYPWLEVDHV